MKISSLILAGALAVFAANAATTARADEKVAPVKKIAKKKAPGKKSLLEPVSTKAKKTSSVQPTGKKIALSDAAKKTDSGQKLSRDIVFDGSSVNGQYHSAGEAVAKVEQEKKLNELAGVRKDFRDRLLEERDRLQRNEPVQGQ